jgi:hypothetical protein
MRELDAAFRKGFIFGVSVLGISYMIGKASWPDWLSVPALLLVWAGYAYLYLQERRRGYKDPQPWWERSAEKPE